MNRPQIPVLAGYGIIISLVGWGLVAPAQAQVFQTHLPYPHNEAPGTGYAGSEVAGGWFVQNEPAPALAHGVPTAYGADWGDVFWGGGFQRYLGPRIPERNDGAVFVGVGLGHARKLVGIELTYAAYDLMDGTLGDGSFSLKLHRRLYEDWAIAVGVEDLMRYGEWISKSAYVVVSNRFTLFGAPRIGASIGIGDGRFNSMDNLLDRKNEASVFGSLGLLLTQKTGLVATWYGQDLSLGMSFTIPWPRPITITPMVIGVTGQTPQGARFAIGVGGAHTF